jgi:hypothetical protein
MSRGSRSAVVSEREFNLRTSVGFPPSRNVAARTRRFRGNSKSGKRERGKGKRNGGNFGVKVP